LSATLTDTPAGPRIHVPMNLKRRSGRKRIIMPDSPEARAPESEAPAGATYRDAMVIAIARAFRWKKLLDEGRYCSISEIASTLGVTSPYVARILRLALIAPDIIEAIVDGREAEGMSLERLRQPMPMIWQEHVPTLSPPATRSR
jgi:hypothetical protein